jgi:hypothetical protein
VTLGRYVLTADVTIPAGVPGWSAAGPATTATGTTSATPGGGTTVASQALAAGTYMLSWTAQLETAAASGDADNFGLYDGSTLLATSVNAGVIGSYPQAAVSACLGAGATVAVKNIAAGSSGSVYAASLTVTPVMGGDNRGAVTWTGPGSPPQWTAGGFPITFVTGTPLWLDSAGPLYAALNGNLAAWIDGTSGVGHNQWGLSN